MISYFISLFGRPLNFRHSSLSAPTWAESYLENKLLGVSRKGCRIRFRLAWRSGVGRCCRELERFNYIWCHSGIKAPLASITSLPLCVRITQACDAWRDRAARWTGLTSLSIWVKSGKSSSRLTCYIFVKKNRCSALPWFATKSS